MCFAIPGKVVEIEGDKIIVDYEGEKNIANIKLIDVEIGNWVIMKNKIIMKKISDEEANKFNEMIKRNVRG